MYPVAIVGNDPSARAAVLAIKKTGWQELTWVDCPTAIHRTPAATLGPNVTRVLQALTETHSIPAYAPDREQLRFTPSGFLLTELPLGKFVQERYGAPHLNIETDTLERLLTPGFAASPNAPLEELEAHHRVVAVSAPPTATDAPPTHQLYWASINADVPDKANVTWIGAAGAAWQFSTPTRHHTIFCAPLGQALDPVAWHPALHPSIAAAAPFKTTSLTPAPVREHWHEGRLVFFGAAGFGGSACYREMEWVGLEDAWVLSRMLENYEEAVDEGLREYARFRRARANRLHRAATVRTRQYFEDTRMGRLGRNLNLALSTRFLPEIAMQRIDWLYGHDCIRGFR